MLTCNVFDQEVLNKSYAGNIARDCALLGKKKHGFCKFENVKWVVWLQPAVSHSIVKFLPGFQGPLPFHHETGYVGVDEAEDLQLFYYFIKSQRNSKEDPLLLWLTGGPGCSSFTALAFKNGTISFEAKEYNGSLPTLVLTPYSWTQVVSSMIFLDLPVPTGFSYARSPVDFQRSDFKQVSQAVQFLRKWLMDHQEFLSNPAYIAGESYSGKIVPAVVQKISNGQAATMSIGYLLGNPVTDPTFDDNSKVPFCHGMGLISDELYEKSCRGEYQMIDPNNAECLKSVDAFDKCISDIEGSHILERKCPLVPPRPTELGKRRYPNENSQEFLHFEPDLPTIGCHGSIGEWQRCDYKFPYTYEIQSSIKYHAELGIKGYRRLIYSGDHDMMIPFLGTQAWIRSLNYSIVDDWRPWHFQGQVAGYTRTYSNQLTFATVKGGGHTAPEYKPAECFVFEFYYSK
ncbi:unnamed protein product [Dovyalis caffra]|uniref:Carboxypeptidase n=1 Tax=Dovyalis caffra TaxID=77055 RepID=A0AAV1QNL4_9ROSI|nr:unnamed protein product [Dovyalis caffra]